MQNVIWFRSDLRTIDNPALSAITACKPALPIRAVFIVTEQQWLNHDWGKNKIGFVLNSVIVLERELAKLHINLDIMICDNFKDLTQILTRYLAETKTQNLYYNLEYELNETIRDQGCNNLLAKLDIKVHTFESQTLIKPGLILTQKQTPYTVFTPFKKACYEYFFNNPVKLANKPKSQDLSNFKSNTNNLIAKNFSHYLNAPLQKLWPAGQNEALEILSNFCNDDINTYQTSRDFPALNATSKLSAHLAIGSISVKQCFIAAINKNKQEYATGNSNIACWISELIWRDFYRNIILHFPELCKGKNFNTKYDNLAWQAPDEALTLWQQGKTGIPIIDAAMRQLVTTGWMHNRLRMIVAMFLSKNLLIDWRHGEKFFAQHLFDLDFASNNGGWQWSASTGTDAVPYFRIFNPITQSQRFDPEGSFIKQFCPELKDLDAKQIHDPSKYLKPTALLARGYPQIMVDLAQSRMRALAYFKASS